MAAVGPLLHYGKGGTVVGKVNVSGMWPQMNCLNVRLGPGPSRRTSSSKAKASSLGSSLCRRLAVVLRVGRAAAFSLAGAAAFAGTLLVFLPTAPRKVGPYVRWSKGAVVRTG